MDKDLSKDELEIDKKKFKLNKKHIFWSIVILAVLHLVFMGLPLALKDNTSKLFGYQYVVVFGKNQDTENQLVGNVVKLKPIKPEEIEVGDDILIFEVYDYGDYYWELEVVDIDSNAKTIRATFEGNIKNTYSFDEIDGEIGKTANIFGIFYYTASTPRGYVIMILFHAIAVYAAYYMIFQNKEDKIMDEEIAHEEESKQNS